MKVAITGHRPNKLGNDYDLTSPLIAKIRLEIIQILVDLSDQKTIKDGLKGVEGITGMALGIDTLFAMICIMLGIPFTAAVPCSNQDSMWPVKAKELYHKILSRAATVYYVTIGNYTRACMQDRNEWMVDNCDVLIAVWDGSNGGTKNCIDYAIKQGKKIIYIKI